MYFFWEKYLILWTHKRAAPKFLTTCRSKNVHSFAMCQKPKENNITKHPLLGWATAATTAAAEEFPDNLHSPIPSHPGMKYPVRASPSLRHIYIYIYILYYFILYYIILYYIILYDMIWYDMIWYDMILDWIRSD